tara:strand:- start:175 stop:1032 length:858 start_codon:yes stop_codon:yes gene_type:complete
MVIKKEEYIDGNKFELLGDIGFGDKYTTQLPLDIKRLTTFLDNFKESRLPLVYVDGDRVKKFFTLIKNIDLKPFKLLSHNGDATFTEEDVHNRPKCVKKWYGQNINTKNSEDIISLPIGLERQQWAKKSHNKKGLKHDKIYQYSQKNTEKNKLCYINFNIKTNIKKRGWILPIFKKYPWAYIRLGGWRGNLDKYFTECKESHFVICPDGNGIDCHRNWEMLYIGVVPIIEKSYFHEKIYGDLPVLIVDSFKNINKDLLISKKNYFNGKYNKEKLKFYYWENIIKE